MSRSGPGLSLVIPAIDEAEQLPHLLADIAVQRGVDCEVIVADGGSRDATCDIARAAGARGVITAAGRGRQMNAGAALARHPRLLFLHADSRLTSCDQLRAALDALARDEAGHPGPRAGHFPLRFAGSNGRAPFLFRYMAAKTRTGRRWTINGDQGLLIRRAVFDALGGFDTEQPFLEDQRFAAALERAGGGFALLPHPLETSARRFVVEGPWRRYGLMALIMAMHGAGVSVFFERAPEVYRLQGDARRLALGPHVGLLGRLVVTCGARRTLAALWRVAGLAANEGWQIAFALDVARARDGAVEQRWTQRYDRALAPVVRALPIRGVIALLLGVFVLGPAWLHAVCWGASRNQ